MLQIRIGADPELFVRDARTGQFVCAHGMVEGTKDHPQPVRKGAVQVDGMALEFNIDPASTADEFLLNIREVRAQMQAMIDPNLVLVPQATAYFEPDYFFNCPQEALMLGCTPDYDAWTGEENKKPETKEPFRTGAGHLHLSGWCGEDNDIYNYDYRQEVFGVMRQLDCMVGMFSPLWDDDVKRRTLYGRAGACRIKKYGGEYRPLSNAWLADDDLTKWVFVQAKTAVELLHNQNDMVPKFGKSALKIINSEKPVDRAKLYDWLARQEVSAYCGMPPVKKAA